MERETRMRETYALWCGTDTVEIQANIRAGGVVHSSPSRSLSNAVS